LKLTTAIDRYVTDMVREGRFTSPHSELAYRTKLMRLAEHVRNRDPRTVGRVDIKTVLAQWPNPASQNQAHAVYASFFDWCLTEPRDRNERETICTTNPARRVRRAKAKQAQVFRMTRSEVVAFLDASLDRQRDRWVAHLGCCAGLRSQEIRGLQGRHFERPGYVWVSKDIGKGGKERWVPVIDDLAPIVAEILEHVDRDRFVIPGRRSKGYPTPGEFYDVDKPVSASAVFKQVVAIGERAGVPGKRDAAHHATCVRRSHRQARGPEGRAGADGPRARRHDSFDVRAAAGDGGARGAGPRLQLPAQRYWST
jgi:integrase